MTDLDTTARAVLDLDPQALLDNSPDNVRHQLGDLKGLTTSIAEHGVIEPVIVCPHNDGGWRLVAGFRRCHAAIAAGLIVVPAVERADLDGADRVSAMLVENLQRQGLTVGEEAKGYEQLSAFGWSATRIAKSTGTKTARVKDALTVAADDTAVAVTDRYDLTLEHALVLAEFGQDHDAIKTLTVTAKSEPEQFNHVASRLRQERDDRLARQATIDDLTAKDIPVIDGPRYSDGSTTRRLDALVDANGKNITPAKHRRCPGRAASIDRWDPTSVTHWCTDPNGNGHHDRYPSRTSASGARSEVSGGAMSEEQKAERREVIANNKAWDAATDVRLAHLRQLFAGRGAPKTTLRWAVVEILTNPGALGRHPDEEVMLANLLGTSAESAGYRRRVGPTAADGCTEARLTVLLAAQVAARFETSVGRHTWRNVHRDVAAYFGWLTTTGYALAPVEQLVVDMATTAGADQDESGDGDEATEVDERVDEDLDEDPA